MGCTCKLQLLSFCPSQLQVKPCFILPFKNFLLCFLQAIIVPCGLTATLPETEKNKLLDKCKELEDRLKTAGVRAKGDYRDNYSPGWKFNHWELKVFSLPFLQGFKPWQGTLCRVLGKALPTLPAPLSTQVYKWVPANLMLGVTL